MSNRKNAQLNQLHDKTNEQIVQDRGTRPATKTKLVEEGIPPHPGPLGGVMDMEIDPGQLGDNKMLIETINITALGSNADCLATRKAHVVAVQEHRVKEDDVIGAETGYRGTGWAIEMGPLIPNTGGPAGCVAVMTALPIVPTKLPAEDQLFHKATNTGRVAKFAVPIPDEGNITMYVVRGTEGTRGQSSPYHNRHHP